MGLWHYTRPIIDGMGRFLKRRGDRRILDQMSERQLQDIGMSRAEISGFTAYRQAPGEGCTASACLNLSASQVIDALLRR